MKWCTPEQWVLPGVVEHNPDTSICVCLTESIYHFSHETTTTTSYRLNPEITLWATWSTSHCSVHSFFSRAVSRQSWPRNTGHIVHSVNAHCTEDRVAVCVATPQQRHVSKNDLRNSLRTIALLLTPIQYCYSTSQLAQCIWTMGWLTKHVCFDYIVRPHYASDEKCIHSHTAPALLFEQWDQRVSQTICGFYFLKQTNWTVMHTSASLLPSENKQHLNFTFKGFISFLTLWV